MACAGGCHSEIPAVMSQRSCQVLQVLTDHGFGTSLRSMTDSTTAANAVVRQKREERIRCDPYQSLQGANVHMHQALAPACLGPLLGKRELMWCACSTSAVPACLAQGTIIVLAPLPCTLEQRRLSWSYPLQATEGSYPQAHPCLAAGLCLPDGPPGPPVAWGAPLGAQPGVATSARNNVCRSVAG